MSTISKTLAEFTEKLAYGDLPEKVVYQAKRFLLDSVGCAIGATRVHDTQIYRQILLDQGGTPEATIFGWGDKMSVTNASLLNALLIRGMDFNDIYWKQDPSHPSDLIPAALAIAERKRLSGKTLILGIVIAYEFEQRLCEFAFPGIRERKWHHATLTQFASPLVAGKMLGLNPDQIVNAMGISACHNYTPGIVAAGKLGMMKNTVDPLATQSGVIAALLAEKGYDGPSVVFEGKEGLFEVLGDSGCEFKPEILTDGLGESFRIMQCSMKGFPTEALTHTFIGTTLSLVRKYDIRPDDVEEVTVNTIFRAADILADPSKYKPENKETADHSLPYVVAAAIADRKVTPASFKMEKIKDPVIWELMPKIKAVALDEFEDAFPAKQMCDVIIRTKDGNAYKEHVDYPKGDPRNPLDEQDLNDKFDSLTQGMFDEKSLARLKDSIWNVDDFKTVNAFMATTVSDC
ncbi:MAG: 2-methylcitrate dehydratase [Candidatus Cloacimonetes bacterium 4572_55]|nr:MAG: 2-methylcitrate dehydratase [Candidatus Cloacimonetes bacterium 4572_55]